MSLGDPRYARGGLFDSNLFRVGTLGLGDLPDGAAPVSSLSVYRRRFPSLPNASVLESKGATHFTTKVTSGTSQEFTFYTSDGERAIGPLNLFAAGAGPVEPDVTKGPETPLPARQEGDGLLPGRTAPRDSSEPKWLPWALLGGGVVVAGGIVWAATRKPAVAANRRRRRRRRRRTSR